MPHLHFALTFWDERVKCAFKVIKDFIEALDFHIWYKSRNLTVSPCSLTILQLEQLKDLALSWLVGYLSPPQRPAIIHHS